MQVFDRIMRYGLYGWLEGTDRQDAGNVWFVDGNSGNAANNANSGQGESWSAPFANINYAISRCSNDAGDVIFVAANHTETIADTNDNNVSGTTTDEFCVDKSGITIIGLGSGTRRPTITLATATDACIDVRAANCVLYNLIFYNTIANNVAMLDAQATADGLIIENCMFYESAANTETVDQIILTANCDDVTIRGCRFHNVATNDGSDTAIVCEGAITRLRIQDCIFRGDWNEHVIEGDTAQGYDVEIIDNVINQLDATAGSAIDLHASTTGVIKGNIIHCPSGSAEASIIADGCLISQNETTINEGQDTERALGRNGTGNVGNHWYVDSGTGTTTGDGKSWDTAMSLVDDAIGLCTENNGDVIHVAAGHSEADMDGTAGQIFDVDKAGISIIGEGIGDTRPTFKFTTDTTNAVCYITGADVLLKNLIFECGVNSQDHIIDVAADDVTIENCEFRENAATPLSCITADSGDGAADNLIIKNCRFYLPTAGNQDNAIEIGKDNTGVRIIGNYIMGDFDEAAVEIPAGGNACQDIVINDNIIINEQSGIHCIEVDVAALTVTGVCARNTLVCDTRSAALQGNILSCVDNVWIPLGGNLKPVKLEEAGVTPGNHVYVDSALGVDDTAHGTTWEEPVATIDYAVGLCAADNGDTIHVAPGHSETLETAATDLAIDVNSISIIGYGNEMNRPKLLIDTENNEGAPIVISGNNVLFKHFLIEGNKTGGSQDALEISGNDVTVEDCIFYESANTKELAVGNNYGIITLMDGSAAVARCTIKDCKFLTASGGNNESAIAMTDGSNGVTNLHIINCYIFGTFADNALQFDQGAAVATNCMVKDCVIINDAAAGGAGAVLTIDNTAIWYLIDNSFLSADGDAEPVSDDAASYMVNTHTCEKGAYSSNAVQGSVTNWGA